MKALLTGPNGFLGSHIRNQLDNKNVQVVGLSRSESIDDLHDQLASIDFVFHTAGVNRTQNSEDFYSGNLKLTQKILNSLKEAQCFAPILYTSSTHAIKDNDYGKSKKMAEAAIREACKEREVPYYIFRLPNIFGPGCRPNYNSALTTFCYNISHDLDITVTDPQVELSLVFAEDTAKQFVDLIESPPTDQKDLYEVSPVYKARLGDLVEQLYEFKQNGDNYSELFPNTEFVKSLYETYNSYINYKL